MARLSVVLRLARSPRDAVRSFRYGTIPRLARNPSYAARGFRYATRMPPPRSGLVPARSKGPLERYFDAHTEGPGLWKWRHYFDIYERHLRKFVDREVHLVEIGIFSGGSLEMWRHYLGDQAHIYGVDIEPACRAYERDGTRVFIGDQGSFTFWERFRQAVPTVDVLIDDGGHAPHQQIATLQAMLPHMQPGGVYLCEDIAGAAQPFHAFIDGLCRPLHMVTTGVPNSAQQQVASVHRYPLVTVIEKPALPVAHFESLRHGSEWQPFM